MRRTKGISIMTACLLGILTSCVSTEKDNKNNIDSWIHLHPNGLKSRFEEYKEFGRRAKEDGYSTIIVRFTNARGYDKAAAKELIKYYKHDLGLKVIPEFKLLGKSQKTYSPKFIKEHPELFAGHVLDPYAKYKGKPAFDSLIIPMVNEHIELFENPEYFMLGWDEYNTDDIKKIADRNGKTISDVWAGTLNRVNDYLLSKDITPIIFGDQLISKQLAKEGNPAGYPADKRFENYSAMHGIYPPQSKTDMIEFVKDIKNKNKIVIADWHYENETEYPSFDYFKWQGFKEVIPVTWGKEGNMKYFSKYAQQRGAKKMMASVWHYSFHPAVRHLLWPTVDNSIIYFNNPNMVIPKKPKVQILKDGKPISSAKPGDSITLKLEPSGKNVEFEVYPVNKFLRLNPTTLKSKTDAVTWKIPMNAKKGFWTIQGYSKRKDGYLLHGMLEAGLFISQKPLVMKRQKDGSFMGIDFSNRKEHEYQKNYVLLKGNSEANYGIIEGDAKVRGGALLCKNGGILVLRSNADVTNMSKNKTVMLEFSINKFPGKKQEWAGLLTWGHYGSGFRMILWHKKLYVQIFGGGNQKCFLTSKKDLEVEKKYLATFNINDKKATLYLNGVEQAKEAIPFQNKIPVTDPLAVGCSYAGKLWKCFDGKIYRFAIWNKYVDLKTAEK